MATKAPHSTTIPADLRLKYCINHTPTGPSERPEDWREVVFAEPRETYTKPAWSPKGMIEQEYVRVLNPDIWGGEIRYPFEREFMEVKA
jgi:hypothetical protein